MWSDATASFIGWSTASGLQMALCRLNLKTLQQISVTNSSRNYFVSLVKLEKSFLLGNHTIYILVNVLPIGKFLLNMMMSDCMVGTFSKLKVWKGSSICRKRDVGYDDSNSDRTKSGVVVLEIYKAEWDIERKAIILPWIKFLCKRFRRCGGPKMNSLLLFCLKMWCWQCD